MSRGTSLPWLPYAIIIMLWVWSPPPPAAWAVTDDGGPRRCGNVEIVGVVCNETLTLPENFRRCQILEGHLKIQLVEDYFKDEEELIANLKFPDLVQVTDYVMIYRVSPLKTLDDILPNLSVIRGHNLFHGYALVVFANTYLEKLGLNNLTDVLNGSVRIEKNWILCPGLPNRWENITKPTKTNEVVNVIKDNHIYCIYHPCETHNNCSTKVKHHYKVCSDIGGGCYQGRECDPECAGGCLRANNASACIACRHFSLNNGTCVNSCRDTPSHHIVDKQYLCVDKCDGKNVYQVIDQDGRNRSVCNRCKGENCSQGPCKSTTIDSNDLGRSLKECKVIEGHLIITVVSGVNVPQQLEENLKNIEVVTDYIRVFGSHILYSLNFLKNLRRIGGQRKEENLYALYVMENENLQELWDSSQGPRNLTIGNHGSFYFHFNPKLCPKLIDELANSSGVVNISSATNGQSQPCYESEMEAYVRPGCGVGSIDVTWKYTYNGNDQRFVIGYYVFYREAPHDITLYENRDACNDERLWDRSYYEYTAQPRTETLKGLDPFTRYAVYVMAYYTDQVKRNGSRSKIHYVITSPTYPSAIRDLEVNVKDSRPNILTLEWKAPITLNGNLWHYEIYFREIGEPPTRSKSDVCSLQPLGSGKAFTVGDEAQYNNNYNQIKSKKTKKE